MTNEIEDDEFVRVPVYGEAPDGSPVTGSVFVPKDHPMATWPPRDAAVQESALLEAHKQIWGDYPGGKPNATS